MISLKDVFYGALTVSVIMVTGVSTKYIYHCAKQEQYKSVANKVNLYVSYKEYYSPDLACIPTRSLPEGYIYVNADDPRAPMYLSTNDMVEFIEKGLTKNLQKKIQIKKIEDLKKQGIRIPFRSSIPGF